MAGEDRLCEQCGGRTAPVDNGGVSVFECVDCGNVVGLVDPTKATSASDSEQPRVGIDTDTVTATDGELQQLLTLLRTYGDGEASEITAGRLVLATEDADIVVSAEADSLRVRKAHEDD